MLVDEIDDSTIGELRHDELQEPVQRRLQIERRRKYFAGVSDEPLKLGVTLVLGDQLSVVQAQCGPTGEVLGQGEVVN